MLQKKIVVHATNVHGLGASSVSISLINALNQDFSHLIQEYVLPSVGPLKTDLSVSLKSRDYERILPKSISRFIECFFSPIFFKKKYNYIILGDIPLYGIYNQVVLVHQPNLISPKINRNSSKSFSFRVNRFLFKRNIRFVKKVIVQTEVMKSELQSSYPTLLERIEVKPQPLPESFKTENDGTKLKIKNDTFNLIYPAAGYPHKNHKFLLELNQELNATGVDFKIFVTLMEKEVQKIKKLSFIENLGKIPSEKMKEKYLEFDALLFLSKAESYGLPLIEAMTLGKPIVTIDLPYSRWICEDNAFYFDQDSVTSFVRAIQHAKDYSMSKIDYSRELQKFPKNWNEVASQFIKEFE